MTTRAATPIRLRHRRTVRHPNRWFGPVFVLVVLALILQLMWMKTHWGPMARRTDHVQLDPELLSKLKAKMLTLYECEHCRGNGLITDPVDPTIRELCAICFGVGYHPTRRYTDDERMCLNCGGMGRHYNEAGEPEYCPRCDGRGIVILED